MEDQENGLQKERSPKALSIEPGLSTAHTIDQDPWIQVGLLLVTSFSCGYMLGYSNLILKPLGWTWGLIAMLIIGFLALYANWLLAGFHVIDGQRFIRYRDMMGYLFGRRMYHITWSLQFLMFLLGNMGFILLAGRSLKAIHAEFSLSTLRLQIYIIITGAIYFLFALMIPNMSAMRHWLGVSSVLTITYVVIVMAICVKDGKSSVSKSYAIEGSGTEKFFNAFNAFSAILFADTSGMLPEIQATLRKPVVKNMRKALCMQFTLGLAIYYAVTILGYWAYGSNVSEYLPNNFSGPKWAVIVANATVFLQTIVSQHMFCTPVHEALDTRFLHLDQSMHSRDNIKILFVLRAGLFTLNTFMAALIPFLGDFVNLIGSLSLFPLTFVFLSMIFLKVRGKTANSVVKAWHWINIVGFSVITILTTVAALRLIVENAKAYRIFADN
ncbi:hypothetical protein AMTRI_Chr06g175900 [Amborella trichopoda]|uniref:Amino acid transporter transmembrane domain-containing protein n=1 Tax=Amborella trichopoda TaxID=13333 RepID=W1PS33_AMBTC|nr:probable proline transporter 2 [Amborella trichopoda]ERN10521.1 hypothetical protein AMTR_s00166p00041470 [Amborella trichopoda]|eukprot:XP_020525782.1 probable proline transporter 2 [Amborella trichopoda]